MALPRLIRALDGVSIGRMAFFFRKLRLPICSSDLVIDIGSGGDPHPRADVIVDRSVGGASERTAGFRRSAPTVIADIGFLPFRDRAFDFSICAHVLEHVEDPALAAKEISRISKAGYVETPSDIHERLFPIGWHRWFVRLEDDLLHFEAKETPFLDEQIGDYFRTRWGTDRPLMRFVWSHTRDLFVSHLWRGALLVEVTGRPSDWSFLGSVVQDSMGDAPKSSETKRTVYEMASLLRYRRR